MSKLGCRRFIVVVLEGWPQHLTFPIPPLWRSVSHRWQETKRILHPHKLCSLLFWCAWLAGHSKSPFASLNRLDKVHLCIFSSSQCPSTHWEGSWGKWLKDPGECSNSLTGLPKPPFLQGVTLTFLYKSENKWLWNILDICSQPTAEFPVRASIHGGFWHVLLEVRRLLVPPPSKTVEVPWWQTHPGNYTRFISIFKKCGQISNSRLWTGGQSCLPLRVWAARRPAQQTVWKLLAQPSLIWPWWPVGLLVPVLGDGWVEKNFHPGERIDGQETAEVRQEGSWSGPDKQTKEDRQPELSTLR